MPFQNYVLGFQFSESRKLVTLLRKRRGPAAMIGLWNGVGGKVEADEDCDQAMTREFQEEAGLHIREADWQYRGRMDVPEVCAVHLYRCFDSRRPEQRTSEPVRQFDVDRLHLEPDLVPNVRWLIPLMLDDDALRIEARIR